MRRLLHISDLHFGKIHAPALDSLRAFIEAQGEKIDVIVMTGDWTQRARHAQYKQAEAFIKELKVPVVSVPGNHDIPLYDFVTRFLKPLGRYQAYVGRWTKAQFQDQEVTIWGVQTPASRKAVEGVLPKGETKKIQDFFEQSPPSAFRILAGHHPEPLKELEALKPHIMLSGHHHRQSVQMSEKNILVIAAGSGTSTRLRGEANGFHLIELEGSRMAVRSYLLGDDGFIENEGEKVFTRP